MSSVDVDRPSTWIPYRQGLCGDCRGTCCTMPVEVKLSDLIRLGLCSIDEAQGSVKKIAKRLQKDGFITSYRHGTQFFMLTQKTNRDCHFLDSTTRLCTVYEKRPETCRNFPEIGPRSGFCPVIKNRQKRS